MAKERWMTLDEAANYLKVSQKRLWDYIMGRVPGQTLMLYRLAGGKELFVRQRDLLALLEPVTDRDELAELEAQPPAIQPPGHIF